MHTRGVFIPETETEVIGLYEELGPAAQVVVKETAKAMGLDPETYRERVSSDVIATARDALFASLLEVTVGTREEFDARTDSDGDVIVIGNENVDRVVWHSSPIAGVTIAATFQNEEDAAVDTLRRQAYGRVYREHLYPEDTDAESEDE